VKQNTKEPQVYSSGRCSASEAFTPAQYDQPRQFLADTLQRRPNVKSLTAGKISFTGVTGYQLDVLMAALETDRFDTVLFVMNMATFTEQYRQLLQLAKHLGVGTMVMRPLDHGALPPTRALRFALASEVDTVLCDMYSAMEIDQNLAIAGTEPSGPERETLMREAQELSTGCLRCGGPSGPPCKCLKGIDVRTVLMLSRSAAQLLVGADRDRRKGERWLKIGTRLDCTRRCHSP
jgi:predicted aldo/keto reductase-like oxidoreductase